MIALGYKLMLKSDSPFKMISEITCWNLNPGVNPTNKRWYRVGGMSFHMKI